MANNRMNTMKWDLIKYFKPAEFACPCKKCANNGLNMAYDLIAITDDLRAFIGLPIEVTSGQRCQAFNDSLKGSIRNSDHIKGNAADITSNLFKDKNARFIAMKYIMQNEEVKYCYCDGYYMEGNTIKNYNAKWMGNSIHISVRG